MVEATNSYHSIAYIQHFVYLLVCVCVPHGRGWLGEYIFCATSPFNDANWAQQAKQRQQIDTCKQTLKTFDIGKKYQVFNSLSANGVHFILLRICFLLTLPVSLFLSLTHTNSLPVLLHLVTNTSYANGKYFFYYMIRLKCNLKFKLLQ